MDYDRIGLKPDQREMNSPSVTHQIVVVEEQNSDSPSILWTNYVWIPELSEPDTRLREDVAQAPTLESGNGPQILGNILEPELPSSGAPLPLGLRSGQDLDLKLPTQTQVIFPTLDKSPKRQYITSGPDSSL